MCEVSAGLSDVVSISEQPRQCFQQVSVLTGVEEGASPREARIEGDGRTGRCGHTCKGVIYPDEALGRGRQPGDCEQCAAARWILLDTTWTIRRNSSGLEGG